MDGTAFIRSGFDAIFAEADTDADYVFHELFHQFMRQNKHGEGRFLEAVQRQIDYTAEMWNRYYEGCKEQYGNAFTLDVVYEEITCDLCEYAMSGSEKMYNRLNGLFEGDALETLAEQAREVFEANREAAQSGGKSVKPETRFYMEDTAEEVKDLIAVHNLSADKLESAFGLGGFPMPSIAVTKADMGHE